MHFCLTKCLSLMFRFKQLRGKLFLISYSKINLPRDYCDKTSVPDLENLIFRILCIWFGNKWPVYTFISVVFSRLAKITRSFWSLKRICCFLWFYLMYHQFSQLMHIHVFVQKITNIFHNLIMKTHFNWCFKLFYLICIHAGINQSS